MIKNVRPLLLCLLLSVCSFYRSSLMGEEKPPSPYVTLDVPSYNPGFFSVVNSLFGALLDYEKGTLKALHVNLTWGVFHDPAFGPNWWEYFFEPIALGKFKKNRPLRTLSLDEMNTYGWGTFHNLDRKTGFRLINKYLHLKPKIRHELQKLKRALFKDAYVIGVHYRGTDKVRWESSRVEYHTVLETIYQVIAQIPQDFQSNYKVFVATDEQPFLDYLIESLTCPVVYLEAVRADKESCGIHYLGTHQTNYHKGKEALFDAMLLSKCHFLIRTVSNLSFFSERKNPDMPVILLE